MIITTELAQPIVKKMMSVVDYNINIMNHDGIIVASGDPDRINQPHQGAKEVVQQKRERVVPLKDTDRLEGTKPGVNLPIEFNGNIIGTVGITGHPDVVYKTARVVKITVESLLQQQYLSEQLYYKQKILEEWVLDLINPDYTDFSGLEARSQFLRIDTNNLCTILVIQLLEFDKEKNFNKAQQAETRVLHLLGYFCPQAIFRVHSGKGYFILAVPVSRSNLMEEALSIAQYVHVKLKEEHSPNRIGVGFAHRGVEGWRSSYMEAVQSLDILKRVNPQKGVAHLGEWGIFQLISEVPEKTISSYIARWFKDKKPLEQEVLLTLETFLDCDQNVSETAEKLHIHRNTLLYRLDKIKRSWGLDPKAFGDAMHLRLVMICLKLCSDHTIA